MRDLSGQARESFRNERRGVLGVREVAPWEAAAKSLDKNTNLATCSQGRSLGGSLFFPFKVTVHLYFLE